MNAHHTRFRLALLWLAAVPWILASPLVEAQPSPKAADEAVSTRPPSTPARHERAARAKAAPEAPPSAAERRKPAAPQKTDHMELGTTTVTGNRELPKVMYIVPWKKSDIGDIGGKPMNSLLDEVLAPVDRDVFRREVVYYGALTSGAPQNGAKAAMPAAQGEK